MINLEQMTSYFPAYILSLSEKEEVLQTQREVRSHVKAEFKGNATKNLDEGILLFQELSQLISIKASQNQVFFKSC